MRCKILSQKKSELANFGYIKKVSWKIPEEKFFEYQKSLIAKKPQLKIPQKTPWQKLPKNPLKIPQAKIQQ
jgi:hypothetical protein